MDSTVDKLTERFKTLSPSVRSPALNAEVSEVTRDQSEHSELHGWKSRLRKRQVIAQSVVVDERPKTKKPRIVLSRREPKVKRKAIYIPSKRASQKRKFVGNNLEKVKSQQGVNVKNNLPGPRGKVPRRVQNFNIAFDDDEDDDDLDFVATLLVPSDEESDDGNIGIDAGKKTGKHVKSSTSGAGSGSRNSYPYFTLSSFYTSPTPSPDRLVVRKFLRKPANSVPKKSGKRGMYKRLQKVKEGGDSIPDGPK